MGLVEDELAEVRACCQTQVPGTRVVAAVRDLVRIEIERTECKRLAACFIFPSDYPSSPILFELKSKTLSTKLLDGLTRVTEEECKKHLGKPQILFATRFISKFIDENPLCCCSEEILKVKALLGPEDTIKLSQKSSAVSLTISKENYFLKCKIVIPDQYPKDKVDIVLVDCNFPRVFKTWFVENAKELARRCVEPPLKPKPNAPPFIARPSLEVAASFLVTSVQRYPVEACQVCGGRLFPADPAAAVHNEKAAAHVERVYCGHGYHHDCLILYLKTPPFEGGKKCPGCGKRIYHEKWRVTPELAEAR